MKLRFRNGNFRILQFSDAQDLHNTRPAMIKMLKKALDTEKPDLVVFTGDNILGNHLRDARFGSRDTAKTVKEEKRRMETAITKLVTPVVERKIPFTAEFGNHDDMNNISKEDQADIFRSFTGFTGFDRIPGIDFGSFNLPVFAEDSDEILFNLWLIDTARMNKETRKCEQGVKKETVDWYRKTEAELREKNGGKQVPSLMFQHIACPEFVSIMQKCKKNDPGASKLKTRDGKDVYIRVDPEAGEGEIAEPIDAYTINEGQYEAIKETGDVLAVVLGHDHVNSFDATADGVRVIQTAGASFRCYGDRKRGYRIFDIPAPNPRDFSTRAVTYHELFGKDPAAEARYLMDADGEQSKKYSFLTLTAAAAAAGIYAGTRLLKKPKNLP